ncbi:aldehyde dehydrogenase family protein [Mycobacterium bourgelatii]|uniref:Putative succinate-semialdehyde dehydrogenase [NADP(+)] 2 n=1 Tax=Mycobacterium bourgelatii TaxID=1273442 RepID=A0A7I9YT57_MYCBU|nr:aldehyde dehydrogenase family protein [Mycobacterium bourgelatii]MCV6975849.1 aldehyde dehydrogenase family protein [Mycobacterium bourgelatii]GFG91864.1 phenylacetaldehyde dehydrogenase [Mycobacterium bourgelatii]
MAEVAPAYLGGTAVQTDSRPVYNPAHAHEIVGMAAHCGPGVVDQAVRAARAAAAEWAAVLPRDRKRLMREAAVAAMADFDALTALLTREQGKVLWESALDLAGAPYLLHECSKLIERVVAEDVTENERGRFIVRRRPVGVVGVIVPWNYPVLLAFNGIAAALAAGNTVVVKPPELAPMALTKTVTAVAAALPPGVLNVVPGDGAETGDALAGHPLVRRVLFTGGVVSGREVMRSAAQNITGVGLELGGNDPALVLSSAVVDDELVKALRHSAFTCSGQICFAIKRIYVHRSHYRELVGALEEAVNEIAVGDGLNPESTIGPLITQSARQRVQRLIDDAADSGAAVRQLGRKVDPATWDEGHFLLPHIVSDIAQEAELVAAEQFGPALPILPFDSEDEAIRMANDSEFGLAASVWTQDDDHAFEVARQIEAGTVCVNVHRAGASDHTTPFGGVKQSGIGRINGWASIEEVTDVQTLIRRDDAASLPGPH